MARRGHQLLQRPKVLMYMDGAKFTREAKCLMLSRRGRLKGHLALYPENHLPGLLATSSDRDVRALGGSMTIVLQA